MYKPKHFSLQELACPHVYNAFGDLAWPFFDEKLLITMDYIRDQLGVIYVNNWDISDEQRTKLGLNTFDERGFRCIKCSLVRLAITENRIYVSPHMTGQAVDFDVIGKKANEVRLWLSVNQLNLPYPIRLENKVNWVHLDTRNSGQKLTFFNS